MSANNELSTSSCGTKDPGFVPLADAENIRNEYKLADSTIAQDGIYMSVIYNSGEVDFLMAMIASGIVVKATEIRG